MRTNRTGDALSTVSLRVVWLICFLLSGFPPALSSAETDSPLQDTIVRGLRWYFHWEKAFPDTRSVRCQGEGFGENYFVFCNPGAETLDLTTGTAGNLRVNTIASVANDFATELRVFSAHHKTPTTGSFLFPVSTIDLALYNIDPEVSKDHMEATTGLMREALRVYEQRGHNVRCLFPLVAKTDPFYEVYLAEGDRVDAIWLFHVADGKVQENWQWVYDAAHHNIPETAQSHLADPSRWYASLPSPIIK